MSIKRPTSKQRPRDQSSETPSGKKVPMAMSMMVDSMVRMIQKANSHQSEPDDEGSSQNLDGN